MKCTNNADFQNTNIHTVRPAPRSPAPTAVIESADSMQSPLVTSLVSHTNDAAHGRALPEQVSARLREFATIRAMEAAHNAAAACATAPSLPASGVAAPALRSGESWKPCKLRMRSAQATDPLSLLPWESSTNDSLSPTALAVLHQYSLFDSSSCVDGGAIRHPTPFTRFLFVLTIVPGLVVLIWNL